MESSPTHLHSIYEETKIIFPELNKYNEYDSTSSFYLMAEDETMPLPDADKKLAAIKKLSELSYNSKKAGSNEDRGWNGVTKYISNARDILKVLGPDYDEAVALGVVRGINRGELKETIAAIMWDKEWKLETVIKILKAVIQKEIWEPTVLN